MRRRRLVLASGAMVVVALAGVAGALWFDSEPQESSIQAPTHPLPREGKTVPEAHAAKATPAPEMPPPVHIAIPAIDVSAKVVPLGLNADRTLEVPANLSDTGWFTEGPEPGESGAAVVVGHVASRSGTGVFYRLRDMRPGDIIRIRLRDGEVVRYRARSAIVVSKTAFPTKRIYARTSRPTLRLITCGGAPDAATGVHPDNRIVFASLVSVT
jgi:LPXTG-site transpeptidase (sortase) family protein